MSKQVRNRRTRTSESGFSLVFVCLGGLAFIAVGALAIDVGMLMTARNQAQNAADSGALAGATALAFDNWTDRTPTGPAVVNARTAGQSNLVVGAAPVINPEDVTFPLDPAGVDDRVQVRAWRDAAHGNAMDTAIARIFGVNTVNVNAVATAEASDANAMTCVKPFTIPDKWIDSCSIAGEICPFDAAKDSFERYDKKGGTIPKPDVYQPAFLPVGCQGKGCTPNPNYSGYNAEINRGMRLVLRASTGTNINPSFYFSLAMTDDTGGDDYRWNIANCNHSIYHWSDPLVQEPGSKEGPTIQGILDLIARDPGAVWNDSLNNGRGGVDNSAFGDRQSPRVFPIPLYDPDYYDYGQQNGRVASLKVANWIGFFVEYVGSYSDIHGRIIPIGGIRDYTSSAPSMSSFPKVIRLVQ